MCVTILRPRSRSLVLASRRVLAVLAAMNARTTARTGVVVQLMIRLARRARSRRGEQLAHAIVHTLQEG